MQTITIVYLVYWKHAQIWLKGFESSFNNSNICQMHSFFSKCFHRDWTSYNLKSLRRRAIRSPLLPEGMCDTEELVSEPAEKIFYLLTHKQYFFDNLLWELNGSMVIKWRYFFLSIINSPWISKRHAIWLNQDKVGISEKIVNESQSYLVVHKSKEDRRTRNMWESPWRHVWS